MIETIKFYNDFNWTIGINCAWRLMILRLWPQKKIMTQLQKIPNPSNAITKQVKTHTTLSYIKAPPYRKESQIEG